MRQFNNREGHPQPSFRSDSGSESARKVGTVLLKQFGVLKKSCAGLHLPKRFARFSFPRQDRTFDMRHIESFECQECLYGAGLLHLVGKNLAQLTMLTNREQNTRC